MTVVVPKNPKFFKKNFIYFLEGPFFRPGPFGGRDFFGSQAPKSVKGRFFSPPGPPQGGPASGPGRREPL
jgi:hypothetical protein